MVLKLYNTLTGKKEVFTPSKKEVLMYSCGPTVHDYAHIGNFRTFVFVDVLRRWLEYRGYDVKLVMNITDIDEKTIERARRKRMELKEVTKKYADAFFDDLRVLNIKSARFYPRASEHIRDMAGIASQLLKNGRAFKADDGTVYFDITKAAGYGTLSRKEVNKHVRARTKREDYDVPKHFALWKSKDDMDGGFFFETELGRGRPSWHLECCTMAMKYLGPQLDIHTGGLDLIFPHHENSAAVSEAITGRTFVKYWIHVSLLKVNGKKMSKTLRNYFTLRDILKKGYSPMAIRLILLSNYREELNFTFEKLDESEKKMQKLNNFLKSCSKERGIKAGREIEEEFENAMDDDLDIKKALNIIFKVIDAGRPTKEVGEIILKFNKVLGILVEESK